MENEHEEFKIRNEAVDDIVKILSDCRGLHPQDAEIKFNELEILLKYKLKSINGNKEKLDNKLNEVHEVIIKLGNYSHSCEDYFKLFSKLRNYFGSIQADFLNPDYKKDTKVQTLS